MAEVQPLRRLLDPRRPLTYGIVQAGENVPGGVPYIRPVDMTQSAGVVNPGALLRTSPEIAAQYRRSEVREGDLVLSIGPSYGKVMIVPITLSGSNLTQGTARLALSERLDRRWVYWFLQSQIARDHWNLSVAGGTFAALNLGPLGETPVPVWPIERQRRIAAFLDDHVARIDTIITARRAQLELVGETLTASLDALFDGSPRPLRTMLEQAPCYGVLVPKFVDDGVALIRVNDLLRLDDGHELPQIERTQSTEYRRTVVEEGDVLVSVVGSIDKSAIVSRERAGANVARAVARLRPARGVPSTLIHGWLSTTGYRDQARLATGGDTAQPTLNMGDLSGFRIAVPDCDLTQLGGHVTDLRDRAASASEWLAASVSLLTELKQSLITAAVTGDFDVSSAGGSRVSP